MAEQLSFPQPKQISYAAVDFFPTRPSAVAREMLEAPASWPNGKLILTGEPASGKTHLAHIWAARHAAQIHEPSELPTRSDGPVVVDRADTVAQYPEAQESLFHLHNNLAAAGHPLLLIGRHRPGDWQLSLADLKSRMEATTTARIEAPDDAALTAILIKLMADRQLSPAPNLTTYLTRRMGRSYAEAARIVDALDGLSLREGRRITTALAAQVLDAEAD